MSVIEGIYAAAEAPEGWTKAMRPVADAVRSHIAVLNVRAGLNFGMVADLVNEVPEESVRRFHEYYVALDPIVPVAPLQRPWHYFSMESLGSPERLYASEFYNDFSLPLGGAYSTYAWCPLNAGSVVALAFHRESSFGPFTSSEFEFLDRFTPHVCRALRLSQRLVEAERGMECSREALAQLAVAVFEVDAKCRLVWANRSGRRLLAEGDGLTTVRGQLRALQSDASTALHEVVGRQRSESFLPGRPATTLPIPRGIGRPPLHVEVLPLPTPCDRSDDGHSTTAIVFASAPDATVADVGAWLRSAFELTRTETKVCLGIVDGASVAAIADRLEISQGTARNHLKACFRKLGVSSQPQLVRLLRRLSPLIRSTT